VSAALRAEWLKLTTTRTWWLLAAVLAVYVAVIAAFITFAYDASGAMGSAATGGVAPPDLDEPSTVTTLYTLGVAVGYVFSAVLGVLVITTEHRYRTLTPTFLAVPRRFPVLLAKLALGAVTGLVYGVAALVLTVPVVAGVLSLTGHPLALGVDTVQAAIWRSVLAHALWAAVGVGLGMLVRNQVAAVIAVIAISQLVEPLLRIGLAAWSVTRGVSRYLPGAAADALTGASIYTASGGAELLAPWQGGLVLLGYALVLVAAGIWLTARRDVH
jgi:hypothetical protein